MESKKTETPEMIKLFLRWKIQEGGIYRMGDFTKSEVEQMRDDILERIKLYKSKKALLVERELEIEEVKKWAEENNINLESKENGK